MEEALLKVGKDSAFRKDWQDVVPKENAFEQMFTGREVLKDVKVYTDWRPQNQPSRTLAKVRLGL